MCLLIGKTYGIPTTALRHFNIYGPRQALTNPYTGACAIFTNRILNHKPPHIFDSLLGYEPSISLEEGLRELAGWAIAHEWGAVDLFERALRELEERKLAS